MITPPPPSPETDRAQPPDLQENGAPAAVPVPSAAPTEDELFVLHHFLADAHLFGGDLAVRYIEFVRVLRERLFPAGVENIRTACADGSEFLVNVGDRLGCDFYFGQNQERLESRLFARVCAETGLVFDVGANFGYYALLLATGSQREVAAFEPNPHVFELLEKNVRRNGVAERVACQACCVGAEDRTAVEFFVCAESAFSGLSNNGRARVEQVITRPMRRLDSVWHERGRPAVAGLKLDVEGFEFAVLEGAMELIAAAADPVILLESSAKNLTAERRDALAQMLDRILRLGFTAWTPDESESGGLRRLAGSRDALAPASANLFLTRADSRAETALRETAKQLFRDAGGALETQLALDPQTQARRHPRDPLASERLLASIIQGLVARHETEAFHWQLRCKNAELSSEEYLRLLRAKESEVADSQARWQGEVADWRSHWQKAEAASSERLRLLQEREREIGQWRLHWDRSRADSEARLRLAEKRETEAAEWKARWEAAQEDADDRLLLLREHAQQAAEWKSQCEAALADADARLQLLRGTEVQVADWRARWEEGHAESDQRLALLRTVQARAEAAENDSQARLRLLTRANEELQAAQTQLKRWQENSRRFGFLAAQAWRNVVASYRWLVKS